MKKITDKEIYRLWVEYLKESEAYKYYCSFQKKSFKAFLNEQIKIYFTNEMVEQRWWEASHPSEKELYKNLIKIDTKYRKMEKRQAIYAFFKTAGRQTYNFFGNIHAPDYDFEQWWSEYAEKRLLKERSRSKVGQLDDARCELLAINFDTYLHDMRKEKKRFPTEEEIKQFYSDWHGERKGFITLAVSTLYPTAQLIEEFKKIIEAHKKKYKITLKDEQGWMNTLVPIPIAGRMTSELETYLKVYRLYKQNTSWIRIIKTLGPAYVYDYGQIDENGRRIFQGYLSKAKRIIKNIESGIFPGEY